MDFSLKKVTTDAKKITTDEKKLLLTISSKKCLYEALKYHQFGELNRERMTNKCNTKNKGIFED